MTISTSFRSFLGAMTLGAAGIACAQSSLVSNSPFSPAEGAGGQGATAPVGDYELAGCTVQNGEVSICISEHKTKRSRWIPVGGDADGVRVVSYDEAREIAVVLVNGDRKELAMRKAVVAAAPPVVQSPSSAPIQVPTAATQAAANEQKEARMLVSDLLEIGIQQRKAYQDAKKKAAGSGPGN